MFFLFYWETVWILTKKFDGLGAVTTITLKNFSSDGSGYSCNSLLSLVCGYLLPTGGLKEFSLSSRRSTELKWKHAHFSLCVLQFTFRTWWLFKEATYVSISCSMRMVSLILQRILFSRRLQIFTMGTIELTPTIWARTGVPEHKSPRNRAIIFGL